MIYFNLLYGGQYAAFIKKRSPTLSSFVGFYVGWGGGVRTSGPLWHLTWSPTPHLHPFGRCKGRDKK